MKNQFVKIKSIIPLTHDMLKIVTEKPSDANYHPGQATEIFINKSGWESEGRPFTFTGLPKDDYLEFMIKTYPERKGMTNELLSLKAGDELIINDIFGAIEYKGPGTFIAGGAGITPFVSILRDLRTKNELGRNCLIYANKTKADIAMRSELIDMLAGNYVNILSDEKTLEYAHGYLTDYFIKAHSKSLKEYFYLCGPPPMMEVVEAQLKSLHVPESLIVKEAF